MQPKYHVIAFASSILIFFPSPDDFASTLNMNILTDWSVTNSKQGVLPQTPNTSCFITKFQLPDNCSFRDRSGHRRMKWKSGFRHPTKREIRNDRRRILTPPPQKNINKNKIHWPQLATHPINFRSGTATVTDIYSCFADCNLATYGDLATATDATDNCGYNCERTFTCGTDSTTTFTSTCQADATWSVPCKWMHILKFRSRAYGVQGLQMIWHAAIKGWCDWTQMISSATIHN